MKIGIYNCYWNTYGGGEKHMGGMAQYLSRYGMVDLIGIRSFSIEKLEKQLNLKLGHCKAVIVSGDSDHEVEELSSDYDLWINGTFQSSAISNAKRSILFVMFPFLGKPVLDMIWKMFQRQQPGWILKLLWEKYGFWNNYDAILANSAYTQYWIKQWWGAECNILEPYIDHQVNSSLEDKQNIILSVGRFFVGGHSKKQDVTIRAFKELYDSGACPGWEYHLCGGTHDDPTNQAYLNDIINSAKGYPIYIHPDIDRTDLGSLYYKASIFWHASGYGVNGLKYPDQLEHFGITTVEAMDTACVPIVCAKGGQKLIVQHGSNGYLWQTLEELRYYTSKIMDNQDTAKKLRIQALKTASSYSYDAFSENMSEILTKIL